MRSASLAAQREGREGQRAVHPGRNPTGDGAADKGTDHIACSISPSTRKLPHCDGKRDAIASRRGTARRRRTQRSMHERGGGTPPVWLPLPLLSP